MTWVFGHLLLDPLTSLNEKIGVIFRCVRLDARENDVSSLLIGNSENYVAELLFLSHRSLASDARLSDSFRFMQVLTIFEA